jgi:alpha-L-fucosidase 2
MSTSAKSSATRHLIPTILVALTAVAATPRIARPAEVNRNIDYENFLSRHDLVWNKLPTKWGDGAFTGNGLLGLMMYLTDDGTALRFRVGRSDVMIQEKQAYRVPIGDLVLKPVGKITGGEFRQDLWNAEVRGTLRTDKGEIHIRFFTHAIDAVNVIEIKPSQIEKDCKWEFHPGLSANPRWIRDKQPIPDDEKSPPPTSGKTSLVGTNDSYRQGLPPELHFVLQKVFNGDEYATAWQEDHRPDARVLVLSVGYAKKGQGVAVGQAQDAVAPAILLKLPHLEEPHRKWWHDFYQKSFLSVPDTKIESFYWIQLYKLASATRADRPAVDLMGPWYNDTPWPRIWWNLNLQLTYYPVYTANHLELGESLTKMIDNGAENLAQNAKEFSDDSETIGRTSGYNCRAPGGNEMCNYPWALHNYYMQYRYSMDDAMLRDRLLPRMKRAMNYYFHFLKEGDDGKLHTTKGFSPEYPKQPTPSTDVNIDLALIRWLCQALIDSSARLKIDDPLIPKWKDTLARLAPYPTDEHGLRVSNEVGWTESHRHYSHLLMIYPLYVMNWDNAGDRPLITKSFDHWLADTKAFRGYSWTGAASIAAAIDRPDDAVKFLNEFLRPEGKYKCLPNTHYAEAGPVIETPLSGARTLQDILLTSWGGTIRIFPGVPDAWKDVTFHNLRAEGAFLVSAQRRGGQTQMVRIESLAGEPCRVKFDGKIHDLKLAKGESITLGDSPDAILVPVPAQPGRSNTFGLP